MEDYEDDESYESYDEYEDAVDEITQLILRKDYDGLVDCLNSGVNPDILIPYYGDNITPLQYISDNIFDEELIYKMVKLFLHYGANPKVKNERGENLMFLFNLYPSVIQLLIDHGVNPQKYDNDGDLPFINLLRYECEDYTEPVEVFLKNNVDPNLPDPKGKTMLYYACKRDFKECVKLLLEYGAKSYLFENNKNPISVASYEIKELIEQYEDIPDTK